MYLETGAIRKEATLAQFSSRHKTRFTNSLAPLHPYLNLGHAFLLGHSFSRNLILGGPGTSSPKLSHVAVINGSVHKIHADGHSYFRTHFKCHFERSTQTLDLCLSFLFSTERKFHFSLALAAKNYPTTVLLGRESDPSSNSARPSRRNPIISAETESRDCDWGI